jgi:hypothetical protein
MYIPPGVTVAKVTRYITHNGAGLTEIGLNGFAIYSDDGSTRLAQTGNTEIWLTAGMGDISFTLPLASSTSGRWVWLAFAVNNSVSINTLYSNTPHATVLNPPGFRRAIWSLGATYGSSWPATVNFATAGNDQSYLAWFGLK